MGVVSSDVGPEAGRQVKELRKESEKTGHHKRRGDV